MRFLVATLPLLIIATPALARDLPARKAGLWEVRYISHSSHGPHSAPVHFRQCANAATERLLSPGAGLRNAEKCAKYKVRRVRGGFVINSVCDVRLGNSISRAVLTGNLNSAYRVKVRSRIVGPAYRKILKLLDMKPYTTTLTFEGKRLGRCTAGQRPGDVISKDGSKSNLVAIEAAVKRAARKKSKRMQRGA